MGGWVGGTDLELGSGKVHEGKTFSHRVLHWVGGWVGERMNIEERREGKRSRTRGREYVG